METTSERQGMGFPAAPELLEALHSLFGWLQAHTEHTDEFFIQSMMQAEAAIRKAKGD